jgi:hypothetical protein
MTQGIFNRCENRLQAFSLWMACVALMLLTPSVLCCAQQVKELPTNHGITGKQPDIYWHDADISLDLDASTKDWSVVVQQGTNPVERAPLPDLLEQVYAIHRAAPNRAVLLADLSAGAKFIGIIGTSPAKLLDSFWSSAGPSLSPDNRYVLFVRFYPMHGADNYEDQYRLYDVLGTRASNWPERPAQDGPPTEPINYDSTLAGVPVYPLKAGELGRENTNIEDGQVHQRASEFIWSADSSKVVFADVQGGVISLVVVSMPTAAGGKPQTVVYPLAGTENVCLGTSEAECNIFNVRSLAWDGESIRAALMIRPNHAKAIEKDLTIPLSKFVLVGK